MDVACEFTFKFPNSETAKKIMKALEVDNYRFIKTKQKDNILIARIEAKSILSLLHTVEDYLACLSLAEDIILKTGK